MREEAFLVLCNLVVSLIVIIITIVILFRRKKENVTTSKSNAIDILKVLKHAKPVPIGITQGWKLQSFIHQQRVWKTKLNSTSPQLPPMTIHGCYSKIEASPQTILNTLSNINKHQLWDPNVLEIRQITVGPLMDHIDHGDTEGIKATPFSHDAVGVKTITKPMFGTFEWIFYWIKKIYYDDYELTVRKNLNRYWHCEQNRCCWLLEFDNDHQDWIFYLAQPIEDMDESILSVMVGPKSETLPEECACKLSALENYFQYKQIHAIGVKNITLPSEGHSQRQNFEDEDESKSSESDSKEEEIEAEKSKPDLKTDKNFMQKFRNMIEEKKEWYEERKRKSGPNLSASKADIATSLLQDPIPISASRTSLDQESFSEEELNKSNGSGSGSHSMSSSTRKKNFLNFLKRTNTYPGSTDELSQGDELRDSFRNLKNSLLLGLASKQRMSQSNGTETPENIDDEPIITEKNAIKERRPSIYDKFNHCFIPSHQDTKMFEEGYRLLATETAADILAEKVKVSNIDISRPYHEQADVTDGWIYCGLDKDVVILRKLYEDGTPLQSYVGKGLISVPPKVVFNALKNPSTRFTYDEMIKKLDVLHDFGNGLKILHLQYEASHLFRKESRDFCILQNERHEGGKYILCLRSVGWPSCEENDDIIRGKFLPSGWIIEPALKEGKVFSMVTYITQLDLASNKGPSVLMEELASKQPLGIAAIRQYLAQTTNMRRSNSGGHLRKLSSSSSIGNTSESDFLESSNAAEYSTNIEQAFSTVRYRASASEATILTGSTESLGEENISEIDLEKSETDLEKSETVSEDKISENDTEIVDSETLLQEIQALANTNNADDELTPNAEETEETESVDLDNVVDDTAHLSDSVNAVLV